MKLMPQEKLIIALDGFSKDDVYRICEEIPDLRWLKVGLELFTLYGPSFVQELKQMNKKIFLDLKFHDIPNTMAGACYEAAKISPDLLTIHACAGTKAMMESKKYIVKASEEMNTARTKIIGVTVLTSWSEERFFQEHSGHISIKTRVNQLFNNALKVGLDGCVCSPLELENLRNLCPKGFELITPGIRLKGDSKNDQERTTTPSEAIKNGASKLVVGRAITHSKDRKYIFKRILDDISDSIDY